MLSGTFYKIEMKVDESESEKGESGMKVKMGEKLKWKKSESKIELKI